MAPGSLPLAGTAHGALPLWGCSAERERPQGQCQHGRSWVLPAQHTQFVPVPTGAPLYLVAHPPSWVVLLFPTSLPPKGFRALLG